MPGEDGRSRLPEWIGTWGSVIAPVSVLTAVLFYFGYVSSRSQYEYFGVDVDAVGLGTQDYVMRSPQPLLVPLIVLTLLGAGLLAGHAAIRDRVTTATGRTMTIARAAGLTLLAAGALLLAGYPLAGRWAYYPLVTPLLLAVGGGLTGYLGHLRGAAPAHIARRAARVLIYVLVAASVFWGTATVAQWSGRGLAMNQARHLNDLPRVILDTKERLHLRDPTVQESALPAEENQTFRYRYRRLRLLVVGRERLFLVPEVWSPSNSTLVVPMDGSVRVQFQFQPHPPS
ncbi:hypothetical protein [Catenuloplanes atrovinosus]|uniref:Uncharacterized protein n=1 Tax=Catenuloplanes atrovinosus TaxID=137266 RepID=A0AAE4CBN5_9ACTN|nr:hypothetical protein [Catenuloplanes atrovinosus]MDR7275775.1 hypothetical protein [Catenuloplanes atrovinosus]